MATSTLKKLNKLTLTELEQFTISQDGTISITADTSKYSMFAFCFYGNNSNKTWAYMLQQDTYLYDLTAGNPTGNVWARALFNITITGSIKTIVVSNFTHGSTGWASLNAKLYGIS